MKISAITTGHAWDYGS